MATCIKKEFENGEWQEIVRKVRSSSPVSSLVAVHTRDINAVEKLEKPEVRLNDHSIDQLTHYKEKYPSVADNVDRILEKKRIQFIHDSLEDLAYLNEHIRDPKLNSEITQAHGSGCFVACYNKSICGTDDDSFKLRNEVASRNRITSNRVVIACRDEFEY